MRIYSMQNKTNFGQLHIDNKNLYRFKDSEIKYFKEKLADTKYLDLIFDSKGSAIKEKMTGALKKIQSFSFFPIENAASVNFIGEAEPIYKFTFDSFESAKKEWRVLCEEGKDAETSLPMYANAILWIEKYLELKDKC